MAYNPSTNIVVSGKTFMDVPAVQFKTPDGATVNFAHVGGQIRFSPTLEEQTQNVANYEDVIIDPITSTLLNQLDSDFVAENIKKDVDLFGLLGTMEAGGGSGYEITTGRITPAETTASLSWEHGLSTIPSLVLIYLRKGWSLTKYMNVVRMSYQYIDHGTDKQKTGVYAIATRGEAYAYSENGIGVEDVPFEINETTVTAGPCGYMAGTRDFVANKSYAWMCIAGDVILS